jgi:hypothetical protein
LEVSVCTDAKGKPVIQVNGNGHNTAKQVAQAYLEAQEVLKKGGK